jgi:plastocyanin
MNKLLLIALIIIVLGAAGYFIMKGGSTYGQVQVTAVPTPTSFLASGVPTTGTTTGAVKNFTVSGTEFAFSPNALSVNKGDTVNVTFTNNGAFPHNFTITELNVKSKTISPGQSDTVTFIADQTGTFPYFCSVPTHKDKGMVGTLTVQ